MNIKDLTLGIDLSSNNVNADRAEVPSLAKAKAKGVKFAAIRTTCGLAIDGRADGFYQECRKQKFLTAAYHLFFYNMDAISQANWSAERLMKYRPELGQILDVEPFANAGPWPVASALTERINQYAVRNFYLTHLKTTLYISLNTVKRFITPALRFDLVDLHLAWYTKTIPSATDVSPFANWDWWQNTSQAIGKEFGVDSEKIDTDYYHDTEADLIARANAVKQIYGEPTATPRIMDIEEVVRRLRVIHPQIEDDATFPTQN